MNSIREQLSIGFQALVFLLVWVVLLLVKGVPLRIEWEAIKLLPDAIGIYAILLLIFVRWAWKCSAFRGWLVTVPLLQGTWKGTLQTTWINPETGQTPGPIDLYLTIRQTFLNVNITMFTAESSSESEAAALHVDTDSGNRFLAYSYFNTPGASVRNRSQIHYGSVRLRITLKPAKVLEGEYWTDRKTTGHMKVSFLSSNLIESFPEAAKS